MAIVVVTESEVVGVAKLSKQQAEAMADIAKFKSLEVGTQVKASVANALVKKGLAKFDYSAHSGSDSGFKLLIANDGAK